MPGQRCIDLVADACLAQRDALDPQSLSLVLWNLSRMGLEDEGFYLSWMPVIQSQVGRRCVMPQSQPAGRLCSLPSELAG